MQDSTTTSAAPTKKGKRLGSVDALRGITVAAMLLVNDPGSWDFVFRPLEHAKWVGATPTDFIFPMFLFIVGVSIALAILPKLEQGRDRAPLRNAALWRAFRIIVLGLLINLLAAWLMEGRLMRYPGVLQRIGVCFAITALLAIYTSRRTWWAVIVSLLVVYTAILLAGGTFDIYNNIVDKVDTWAFYPYVWDNNGPIAGVGHDPEGLLSTLGAIITSLLGLQVGQWLRHKRFKHIVVSAVVMIVVAWGWQYWIPLIKNLWTPSFVLWTAGWSALVLMAVYWLVENRGMPALGRRFGMNAIVAYGGAEAMEVLLGTSMGTFTGTGSMATAQGYLFAPLLNLIAPWSSPYVASLVFAFLFVFLWWIIMLILDWRKWYVKI